MNTENDTSTPVNPGDDADVVDESNGDDDGIDVSTLPSELPMSDKSFVGGTTSSGVVVSSAETDKSDDTEPEIVSEILKLPRVITGY